MISNYAVIVEPYSSGKLYAPRLKQLGYKCLALTENNNLSDMMYNSFQSNTFDRVFLTVEELNTYLSEHKINPSAVIAGSESGVVTADYLADYHSCPGNNPSTSSLRRDKYKMQKAVQDKGLRSIRTIELNRNKNIKNQIEALNCEKVVVKPINAAASEGVHILDVDETISDVIDKLDWGHYNCTGELQDTYIVQEFIDGNEYVVDLVAFNGEYEISSFGLYDKINVGQCHPVYNGYTLLDQDNKIYKEIIDYSINVSKALDISFGPIHMEIMVDDRGPVLIEAASRIHGGPAPVLIDQCYDVGLLDLSIQSLLGNDKPTKPRIHSHGEIAFVISKDNGIYSKITEKDFDQICALDSYSGMNIMIKDEQEFTKTTNLLNCPAMGWFSAANKEIVHNDLLEFRHIMSRYFG